MNCPLCTSSHLQQRDDIEDFINCQHCGTVFKNPVLWPSPKEEKERYLLHQNDIEDTGYQNFVSPIVEAVLNQFDNASRGLDFGAGTGPVITKLLQHKGYSMALWDPFFHRDRSVLETTYDFIVCCEVIEHFHHPMKEFHLMQSLLNKGGKLFCMSDLISKNTAFSNWYYKDDPTHVVFYSEKNLNWIQQHLNFDLLTIEGRLIIFDKG
ncbi:MAG: class I SAM-dependent methyltransferase [Flavobacteriaceae bacterium]|nr:class I SAM-dependent methyltransferase [Flavobacteriaceae bacterium]